jgi:hypothetical protein
MISPCKAALNPASYASPSGEFTLHVDPSALEGQGEGAYEMIQHGKTVWAKTLPFTLYDAVVTDRGVVGGYAYTNGIEGFAVGGLAADPTSGNLQIVILGADGALLQNLAVPRRAVLDSLPFPQAGEPLIDAAHARFMFRVRKDDSDHGEQWWFYDMASGKEIARIDPTPQDPTLRFVVSAVPIRDTPLMLVQWWQYDRALPLANNPGTVFAVVDFTDPAKPQTVWQQVLPGDYAIADTADDPYRSDRLLDDLKGGSAILQCEQPRRFSLQFVAKNQRVSFEVNAGGAPSGWQVREVARQACVPATQPAAAAPVLKTATLEHLGTILLGTRKAPSTQPIRDIISFDIDDRGRIGFLHWDDSGRGSSQQSFVLVTPDGKVVAGGIRPVHDFSHNSPMNSHVAWISGDRWLITTCESGIEKKAQAWFIDLGGPGGARITPIDGFDCPAVKELAACGDGGFIALASCSYKYCIIDWVIRYDANGSRKWSVSEDSKGDAKLFSPGAVAVDRLHGRRVAVLDQIAHYIQFYDDSGKPVRRLDLRSALGQTPNYPANIKFEKSGDIVLLDFDGSPPIWRLTPDGTVRGKFKPQYPDGQAFTVREIRLSPDDRVWTTDRARLLRLDNTGAVDVSLGDSYSAEKPENIVAMTVGRDGKLYTASTNKLTVQVFDPSGKRIQVMSALPSDFASDQGDRNICVGGDGGVYVSGGNAPYLHFNPDGSRLGWEPSRLDAVAESWQFIPGGAERWVLGYRGIWFVNKDGTPLPIQRQPDRNWLGSPQCLAVARDGSAAVIAANDSANSSSRLNLYAAGGSPVSTIPLPISGSSWHIAYDGRRAVVSASGVLVMIDVHLGAVTNIQFAKRPDAPAQSDREGDFQSLSISPDERELWLFNPSNEQARVERYEMP